MSHAPRPITLAEAHALLPSLQRMTAAVALRVEDLLERADADPDARIAASIDACFDRWGDAIELLGARAAGLWRVEFDNGDGYYCWEWPEPDLIRYRPYGDRGVESVPIQ